MRQGLFDAIGYYDSCLYRGSYYNMGEPHLIQGYGDYPDTFKIGSVFLDPFREFLDWVQDQSLRMHRRFVQEANESRYSLSERDKKEIRSDMRKKYLDRLNK